jgi:hypothetical protein
MWVPFGYLFLAAARPGKCRHRVGKKHAEEAGRITPLHQVVGIGHHDFGRQLWLACTRFIGVAAGSGNVVEDPFLMADFFLDVFCDRFTQPFQAFR